MIPPRRSECISSHHHSHEHEHEEFEFDGEIIYTEPLGADPRIAEIVKERVKSAL